MPPSTIATADPDALPATPGAYLLLLRLDRTVVLPPSFNGRSLHDGDYVYAGSAYGRGGIRARGRRHLARHGVRHWHVDWLTREARDVRAAAFPGDGECALIERLAAWPGVRFPLPGFGSSDCRRCPAHLVRVDGGDTADAIVQQLVHGG